MREIREHSNRKQSVCERGKWRKKNKGEIDKLKEQMNKIERRVDSSNSKIRLAENAKAGC